VIGSVPFKAETLGNSLRTLCDSALIHEASWTSNPTFASSRGSSAGDLPASLVIRKMRHSFAKIRQKTRGKRALRVYSEAWPNPASLPRRGSPNLSPSLAARWSFLWAKRSPTNKSREPIQT